jgi:hypothetical protein
MATSDDREPVFQQLKKSLKKHEPHLDVQTDTASNYYLNGPKPDVKGKPVFFGAVQSKKAYVSYHLMPVYMFPDLLDDVSAELKKKMQGKSCFNFKAVDAALFEELDALTRKSFQRFKAEGHV